MRRNFFPIYRYVGREFIFSFLVAFLFFFFIFFVNQMLLLAEDILSKNVPFKDVLLLIIYSLPIIVFFSFPFGSLVGALMTVGRFSSDNEVLAFQASGISKRHIFIPIFVIAVVFSIMSFLINDIFLPKGTINFNKLFRELIYANPEVELEPYSIKRYQNSIIITGDVTGKSIDDLTIIDRDPENNRRIITAKHAVLQESDTQQGVISLQLYDVFSHIADARRTRISEYLVSQRMVYNILLKDISFSLRNPGPTEMSSRDVYTVIQEREAELTDKRSELMLSYYRNILSLRNRYWHAVSEKQPISVDDDTFEELEEIWENKKGLENRELTDRTLHLYKLEFNKKFAVPIACTIFVLCAFPIGILTKRSGRSVGFGIGLLIAVIYWGMLFAGQSLGLRVMFPPTFSMWLPNIVVMFIGAAAFILRRRR